MAKVGPYGLPSTDNDIGRCTCESVMKIMTLVANSSNMHVAARDASIYTDGMDDGKRSTRPWEQGQPDAVPQKSPSSSGRRPTPPRASPRSS